MGIFFAMIAYGRTVKQFLLINWILPAVFGLVWFAVWGGTALDWQLSGRVDIVGAIKTGRRRGWDLDLPSGNSFGIAPGSCYHCHTHRCLLYDGRYDVHDDCRTLHGWCPSR